MIQSHAEILSKAVGAGTAKAQPFQPIWLYTYVSVPVLKRAPWILLTISDLLYTGGPQIVQILCSQGINRTIEKSY